MRGYYIENNVVIVTTSISVECYLMLKKFGYLIKFIC